MRIVSIILGVALALSALSIYNVVTTLQSQHRTIHIQGPINSEAANKFRDVIIKNRSHDSALIYIETAGGSALAAYKIMFYMKAALGDVTCVIDSHAMSAGAVIAASCSKLIMLPNAVITFHMPQFCPTDACKNPRLIDHTDPMYDTYIDTLNSVPFLTEDELKRIIINGEDVTIQGSEVMRRLK